MRDDIQSSIAANEELQDTMDSIDILDWAKGISKKDWQDFIDSYLNWDLDDVEDEQDLFD